MILWLLACATPEPAPLVPQAVHSEPRFATVAVHVDRAGHTLSVRRTDGSVTTAPVGIGRGGLVEKQAMADYVTPTGAFVVDLVLHEVGTHNAVDPSVCARFAQEPEYVELLASSAGLERLWRAMSELDFDGDGAADRAYGGGYVGLHSETAVTGPKMSRYRGTARWFSIALHGTPTPEEDLGASNSGGCVHLAADVLEALIDEQVLGLGQAVTIADGPPSWAE